MNPFATLNAVQTAYHSYVETFQRFKNPAIRDWVRERVAQGLLWREPHLQLSQRFQTGEAFAQLVAAGVLHPNTPLCFTVTRGDREASPKVGNA